MWYFHSNYSPKNPSFALLYCIFSYFIPTFPKIVILLSSYFFAYACQKACVNENERHLANHSRQAYAIQRRQIEKEDDIDTGLVLSESDIEDPDTLCRVQDPLDEIGKAVIMKKRASIQRKAKREVKKRIAERRFLRRRSKCPDIGNTIEEFVCKKGVGSDH